MGKHAGLLVAFNIFLIMSVAPIDAMRTQLAKANVQVKLHSGTEILESVDAQWSLTATHEEKCTRWQTEFETRTIQVHDLTERMKAGGGALTTAQTVLRLRGMTRVYEKAARRECAWVTEKDVDTSALQSTVTENLQDNECFPQAQSLMTHEWQTAQEQIRAMHVATRMLTDQTCTEEDVQRIVAELDGSENAASDSTMGEQIDAASEEADEVTDEFVEAVMAEDESLLQVGEGASFVATLESLVGLVAFLLIWAVLCVIFVPVILMVVGAVLCTLSWVISRFLHRSANLGSCMNWWAHQTQTLFAPGNELITAGACLIAGYVGVLPNINGISHWNGHFYISR